jgi:hypothetical protein
MPLRKGLAARGRHTSAADPNRERRRLGVEAVLRLPTSIHHRGDYSCR